MIRTEELTKRYGDRTVVDRVSLTVPRGGITSIIGANGAGKSTLLSMIGRLDVPDAGTAWVDGMDVHRTPSAVLARRLAVLRQDNHLAVRLTVRDLVAFGRFPHCGGRLRAEDHRHVEDALDHFELRDFAHRHLDQLSGGQRQRAFAAMVLCQDTDYVLLDEPLNNLDMRHSVQVMRLLRRMADERGTTIVIVIHDINVAAAYSDRIVALRDGALVADGPTADVIDTDVLRAVYDMHIPVHEIGGARVGIYFS